MDHFQHLRNVFQETRAIVVGVDAGCEITLWNPAAARAFGYSPPEVLGRPFAHLLASGGAQAYRQGRIIDALRLEPIYGPFQTDFLTRNAGSLRLDLLAYPVHGPDGEIAGATVILRDPSESRKYWEGAARAEQLALIGQLASGIAHEIGTPLNVISGNVEYLQTKTVRCPHLPAGGDSPAAQPCPVTEELNVVIFEAERIAGLIRRLLEFARPSPPQTEPLEVGSLLEATLRLLGPALERSGVRVKRSLAEDLPPVLGDRNQLEQVLLNLMVNSHQAMPQGGEIRVSARFLPPADGVPPMVAIEFADTGVGMTGEALSHMFEPFFTTKANGTGLGLAVCQRIVADHGGKIRGASAPGEGAVFTLELPGAPGGGP